MSETTLIVLICGALIVLLVLLYNMYQESRYRKQIRQQFGHSDQDALLDGEHKQVRDADGIFSSTGNHLKPAVDSNQIVAKKNSSKSSKSVAEDKVAKEPVSVTKTEEPVVSNQQATKVEAPKEKIIEQALADVSAKAVPVAKNRAKNLLTIKELANVDLPWFDKRFDYMAYVALNEPQELHALPRLSNRHYFRVAACTMDDQFQLAEPIPRVLYQGFVMGLQGISRAGLITKDDVLAFADHVQAFAMKMNGQVLLTDADEFLSVAAPLDALCARVDQMIAMHLVSRESLMGATIQKTIAEAGFVLANDGQFVLEDEFGHALFSIVSLDNTPFTQDTLDNQAYRGFSLLFDVPNVPHGVKSFDQFMDLVVRLSSQLGLDLVDDNLEELSMQSLKNIRQYVIGRQEEMSKIGLVPGGELTHRLFS